MKQLILILFLCFSSMGCDNSVDQGKTTNTLSSEFSTLDTKVVFLQRYFKPKPNSNRNYQKLDFSINYRDNSTGTIPGPSDWDIALVAVVPQAELGDWIAGLIKLPQTPDTEWLARIPTTIDYSQVTEWYDIGFGSVVGINRDSGVVIYRNVSN